MLQLIVSRGRIKWPGTHKQFLGKLSKSGAKKQGINLTQPLHEKARINRMI